MRRLLLSILTVIVTASFRLPVSAQGGDKVAPSVNAVVAPTNTGFEAAITFSRIVPASLAKTLCQRMASSGGWRLMSLSHEAVAPAAGFAGNAPKYTQVTAAFLGQPIFLNGAFAIQPFVNALLDQGSLDILFMTAQLEGFRGLTVYSSPDIRVELLQAGGPYRYRITPLTSLATTAQIPVYQEAVASGTVKPEQVSMGSTSVRSAPDWVFGALISSAIALACLVVLLVRLQRVHERTRTT